MQKRSYDAVVIGSGPNGLSAGITLAKSGHSVLVVEGKDTPGGGARSAELTLPGFIHDICSAIHPLGSASPFFRGLDLSTYGLHWLFPPSQVAHPLDDGTAVMVDRSLLATAAGLGEDAAAYRHLLGPHLRHGQDLIAQLLGPFRIPRQPLSYAWFGLEAILPVTTLVRMVFRGERARAMFAGMAAHSMMPLEWPVTGGFAMMMCLLGHIAGYPVAQGGSQRITEAMVACLQSAGGEVVTGQFIRDFEQLPSHRLALFDLTPRQVDGIAGDRLPKFYRQQLQNFRYGMGVFKIDYALDGPIPWKAKEAGWASTVHLGGTLEEIAASERAPLRGQHSERPFVIVGQQSMVDPSRAPAGKQTAWVYCHVPGGSTRDMTGQIEAQLERYAPGFQNRILARHSTNSVEMEQYNPNYVGGDINGGIQDLRQFFTRPAPRLVPYSTPNRQIYLCSSSTPPGGGVHGMCGYYAAQTALRRLS